MERQQLQRKHSSRYLVPPGPSTFSVGSPQQTISSEARRKPARPFEDRAPWTSSFKKAGTLADHDITTNDSQSNVTPSRPGIGRFTQSSSDPLSRHQQSYSDETERRQSTKENRPQRFFGKLAFPRSTKLGGSIDTVLPGRLSMDVNALALRQISDHLITGGELPATSESDHHQSVATTTTTPRTISQKAPITQANSFNHNKSSTSKVVMAAETSMMMKRSNSYRSSTSQWALSPGRQAISPPNSSQGNRPRSFSSLRPASPGKVRGVGNFITSLGLDIFRKKSTTTTSVNRPSSPSSAVVSSSPPQRVAETGHQLRLLHNRLLQWRYLNAISYTVNETKRLDAETTLLNAWASISKLRDSVVQKQVQIEQEKLGLKLKTILSSQMKALEGWGDIERQHTEVLSITSDCLQSMVCRIPLIDAAKVESQSLSRVLWQATDLATTINTTINTLTPKNQSTVPLLYELSQVATTEKSLLEECFELLDFAAALQLQEQSLKCHKIQLRSLRQQELSA